MYAVDKLTCDEMTIQKEYYYKLGKSDLCLDYAADADAQRSEHRKKRYVFMQGKVTSGFSLGNKSILNDFCFFASFFLFLFIQLFKHFFSVLDNDILLECFTLLIIRNRVEF